MDHQNATALLLP